jgi:O-antigen/teichoic acid export membrane protein
VFLKTLKVFFVRGFGAAASFLVTFALARFFNTEDAGHILFSLALISFIGALVTLGSPILFIKLVGAEADTDWIKINSVLSSLAFYTLILGLITSLPFIFYGQCIADLFDKPEIAPLMPIVGVSLIAFSMLQLISGALQGKQVTVFASFIQNVITASCFLILIALAYLLSMDLDATQGLTLYFVCLMCAAVIGLIFWFKDKRAKVVYSFKLEQSVKQALMPLFIVMLMTLGVQWAGQLATGKYLSAENVAFFASAQRTAMLASFVLIAVNLVVAPKFANAFAKDNLTEVNRLSKLSSKFMLAIATPILILMLVLPGFLMSLFGKEYVIAAPLLQIMAIGQFINVITGSVGYLLNMTGHEKDMRNVVLFSGPLAVVLAFVLTKEFGLIGAAYATAISLATQNLLAVFMVKKRLGFNTLNIFRKIA